jgi:hypothetical protein
MAGFKLMNQEISCQLPIDRETLQPSIAEAWQAVEVLDALWEPDAL